MPKIWGASAPPSTRLSTALNRAYSRLRRYITSWLKLEKYTTCTRGTSI